MYNVITKNKQLIYMMMMGLASKIKKKTFTIKNFVWKIARPFSEFLFLHVHHVIILTNSKIKLHIGINSIYSVLNKQSKECRKISNENFKRPENASAYNNNILNKYLNCFLFFFEISI